MSAYELDHVAFAVPSWTSAGPALSQQFGARWVSGFTQEVFSPSQLELVDGMRLELLEPGSAGHGFITDYLHTTQGRPKAHHITFKVADIRAALETARAAGVRTILENIENPWWREAFLHPKDTGLGFLVQLVETSLSLDSEDPIISPGQVPCPWENSNQFPAQTQLPSARLDAIYGLVRDESLARRALCTVLGGKLEFIKGATASAMVFSWAQGAHLVLEATGTSTPALQALVFSQACAPPLVFDHHLIQALHCDTQPYGPLGIDVLDYRYQPAN
ncbi:VOC family protein [Arthrobacter sp. MYb213]|uniref:VOC family protein n=1 Tax=Arthrobacter sp. MYb213 TaxID=1848595 RepID=UPI000CFABD07|nr:VOC family protein [Arthrobacter sp. MYb213]PRB70406.1 hypothetical protein CQ011_09665 [Arthrobacter sp. MYb213]